LPLGEGERVHGNYEFRKLVARDRHEELRRDFRPPEARARTRTTLTTITVPLVGLVAIAVGVWAGQNLT
jgi:hypothetical protein